MTDRAEIERLLQMTGRTLEGLPEEHSMAERIDAMHRPGEWCEIVCHQSDVIELLVGALREALDKPLQKPLTYDEALVSENPVWAESSISGILDDWFYVYGGDDKAAELLTFGVEDGWIKSKSLYNKTWRCWATRPTDEERSAAA